MNGFFSFKRDQYHKGKHQLSDSRIIFFSYRVLLLLQFAVLKKVVNSMRRLSNTIYKGIKENINYLTHESLSINIMHFAVLKRVVNSMRRVSDTTKD